MLKVAILGYRAQGSNHHAPSFARLTDCQIVAVCDIIEERARAGADRYGVPAYTSADEMLDAEDIDIVDIPVSEGYRYELVMKCLKRGCMCSPKSRWQGRMVSTESNFPMCRSLKR